MYEKGKDLSGDTQSDLPVGFKRVELPIFEFGANEQSKTETLTATIEQLPLDEQEQYWQVMDNNNLGFGEKVALINDMLKRYNGDIQD